MAEEKIVIEPVLETVLRFCLDNAKERMEAGEIIVPFTALAVGNELVMQEHEADDATESFNLARKRVADATDAEAYGFCYDGFVEIETINGLVQRDCIIAEGGMLGADYGHTLGLRYKVDDEGNIEFNKEPIYVSKALNYMAMTGVDDAYELEVFTGAIDPEQQ